MVWLYWREAQKQSYRLKAHSHSSGRKKTSAKLQAGEEMTGKKNMRNV